MNQMLFLMNKECQIIRRTHIVVYCTAINIETQYLLMLFVKSDFLTDCEVRFSRMTVKSDVLIH